ncbi:WD repeat-containing protein 43 [Drosophila sulfurigaster albostrigata]|uniref:WD repeat-containing protein 43 n=1 Tax=Drosophila sulfurigaster albostrigata TaxID=89887 RepID=UPI002D21A173|nr:WD repeat-containing protein 43 [Drosophila sulfurigaster albostrigata]
MSVAKKHVLGFSPNGGKFFALVDENGILRVWDTENNTLKQEFTPNLQVSGGCKALTWVTVAASRPKKIRKSLPPGTLIPEKLYIALGTTKGLVVLYSLASGNIERTLGDDSHNGPITSIAYDNNGHLYTVGTDCRALVWSLAEERRIGEWSVGPEKPLNITYLPKSRTLAIASRQIKIYDVDTKELVETCTGHSGEVNSIGSFTYQNNVEYVLTTAKMERIISLWKVNKKGRNKASTCTLLMEDVAHSLACEVRDDGQLRVASVTRNGNIHIYLLNVESLSSEKYIKPKVTLQIASDGADTVEPILAVAAHFVYDEQRAHEILFGYGTRSLVTFEKYTPNYSEKLNVIVRTDPKKLYAKKKRSDQSGTQEALKTKIPIVSKTEVEYNSALPISKKKVQNDVPMEARLESLTIEASKLPDGKLQSQSKTQLLMQALHSQDQTMLKAVLDANDRETIKLTLERLPLEYISPLLNELSTMLQGKAVNVRCALFWLKSLVTTRMSVLMSEDKEELRDKLGICLGIAEHRLHCITEAIQVSGRVQLVINHMRLNANNHLNEDGVLIVDDDQDEVNASQITDKNWSDVEDEDINTNLVLDDDDEDNDEDEQMEADDDVAADVEDLAMTQDSSEDDENESDTDASAG